MSNGRQNIFGTVRVQNQIEELNNLIVANVPTRESTEDLLANSFPFTTYDDVNNEFDFTLDPTNPNVDPGVTIQAGKLRVQRKNQVALINSAAGNVASFIIPAATGTVTAAAALAAGSTPIIVPVGSTRTPYVNWMWKMPDLRYNPTALQNRAFIVSYTVNTTNPVTTVTQRQTVFDTNANPITNQRSFTGPTIVGATTSTTIGGFMSFNLTITIQSHSGTITIPNASFIDGYLVVNGYGI